MDDQLSNAGKIVEEGEKGYSFLVEAANELVDFTSISAIYEYTAKKINHLLNNESVVAVVEYNQEEKYWTMQHFEGMGTRTRVLTKLFGFDLMHLEGEISTKYYEKLLSGKLEEIEFDFPGLFNNKFSDALGQAVKKMFSVEKLYSIVFQQNNQIYGNITFFINNKTGPAKTGLIEAFVSLVSIFLKKHHAEVKLKQAEAEIQESREQAKKELIAAKERAEESDRLKSAFLANMSHEIRTPMNGILGFSKLLKRPELSGEEQKKYISMIEKSGVRMLSIINNIIDISRIQAGLMTLQLKESDLNEQLEYIYTFFHPEIEARGMKLLLKDFVPEEDAVICTDREKVYAILTNLVSNAIKYTKKGSIEFGFQKADEANRDLIFYVSDTGIGIPKDRQEAVFERFIQADIADRQAHQGAGLGLSITKAYLEMLGGKIWVESEEGVGSTFYFSLPRNGRG